MCSHYYSVQSYGTASLVCRPPADMKEPENRLTDWGVLIRHRHICQLSLKSQLLTNICSGNKWFKGKL
jgi:hypothetical protein